MAGSLGRPATN